MLDYNIIIPVILSPIFTGIIFFILKNYYVKWLESRFYRDIEHIKHDLHVAAIKANRLDIKQAEALEAIYNSLCRTYDALKSLTSQIEFSKNVKDSKNQKLDYLREQLKTFYDIKCTKNIYLPKELSTKIEKITNNFARNTAEFVFMVMDSNDNKNKTQVWSKIADDVEGPIKEALSNLEDEMRKIIRNE